MNSHCAIAAWLECLQEKPSWYRNEQVCQGRKSVKRFARSNGQDTALYKNTHFVFYSVLENINNYLLRCFEHMPTFKKIKYQFIIHIYFTVLDR